jgi:hypothetical protein
MSFGGALRESRREKSSRLTFNCAGFQEHAGNDEAKDELQ